MTTIEYRSFLFSINYIIWIKEDKNTAILMNQWIVTYQISNCKINLCKTEIIVIIIII